MARAKKSAFDEKVELIGRIRTTRPADASLHVRKLLSDKSHYVAAEAAKLAGELELSELANELEALFQRVHAGDQPDRGCAVALAALAALAAFHHRASDVYLRALEMVRIEPDGAALVDVAIPVRVTAADALLVTEGERALVDALRLFGDPEAEARAGLARALGHHGSDAAIAALYTKLLAGDERPDVLGACMSGLMMADAGRFLPIVGQYLRGEQDELAELAALAISESPASGSFDMLAKAIEERGAERRGRTFYLAIALLRADPCDAFLLRAVAEAPVVQAEHAISALAVYRHREEIAEAVRAAVERRGNARLKEAMRPFRAPA